MMVILSCTTTPVASSGSGTGTGNPIVIGIVTANDLPVANARVTIRRESQTAVDHNHNYLGTEFDTSGAVFTDENGHYHFTLTDTGTFIIDIVGADNTASSARIVVAENDTITPNDCKLQPLDTLRGTVSFWGGEATEADIYITGTDRSFHIDNSGAFQIEAPVGLVQISIVAESNQYKPMIRRQVLSNSDLGEVMILASEPRSSSYTCDSLIIRAILDSNDLTSVNVSQVTKKENDRIEEFDISPDFTYFNKLDIAGYITVIPTEIGGLLALKELEIQFTAVTSLPESIANLVNITELELNHNRLTSLPESFVNLTPTKELDLKGNRLVLSDELATWATKYSPNWKDEQL